MSEEEIKTSVERLHAYQQVIQEHQAKVWSSIARSALNNNPVTEAARGPSASEFNTAIVHLYRAEAAKAEAWRKRSRYDDQLGCRHHSRSDQLCFGRY